MINRYIYQARDGAGLLISGELMAETEQQAAANLIEQGLFPTSLHRQKSRNGLLSMLKRGFLHSKYVMLLCRELAGMINAGMTVNDGLLLLAGDEQREKERKLLKNLAMQVQGGSTLTAALQEQEDYFSDEVCYMVAVGEHSGRLGEMLQRLADKLERDYETREKLLTIMLYPLFLFAFTLLTLGFIVNFVLPVFASFFAELHAELPLLTRLVLEFSKWLTAYGLLLPPGCLLALLGLGALLQRESIRLLAERAVLKLPVIGSLLLYTELARFSGTLSILLQSGVVIDEALEVLEALTDSVYMRRIITRACEDVRRGMQLSGSLRQRAVFPQLQLGLLHVGEETGNLEEMLAKQAELAEKTANRRAERLKIMLEPLTLLILGGIVSIVVFAIALPILESMLLLSY